MELGELELTFSVGIVSGVYTADAKLCINRPAQLHYAFSTVAWPAGWTEEEYPELIERAGVVRSGVERGAADCNVITAAIDGKPRPSTSITPRLTIAAWSRLGAKLREILAVVR